MSIGMLTDDELVVLNSYRNAKIMESARIYIVIESGQITQLEVTERSTKGGVMKMMNKTTLRD